MGKVTNMAPYPYSCLQGPAPPLLEPILECTWRKVLTNGIGCELIAFEHCLDLPWADVLLSPQLELPSQQHVQKRQVGPLPLPHARSISINFYQFSNIHGKVKV